jgi:hypothetical protein
MERGPCLSRVLTGKKHESLWLLRACRAKGPGSLSPAQQCSRRALGKGPSGECTRELVGVHVLSTGTTHSLRAQHHGRIQAPGLLTRNPARKRREQHDKQGGEAQDPRIAGRDLEQQRLEIASKHQDE